MKAIVRAGTSQCGHLRFEGPRCVKTAVCGGLDAAGDLLRIVDTPQNYFFVIVNVMDPCCISRLSES